MWIGQYKKKEQYVDKRGTEKREDCSDGSKTKKESRRKKKKKQKTTETHLRWIAKARVRIVDVFMWRRAFVFMNAASLETRAMRPSSKNEILSYGNHQN